MIPIDQLLESVDLEFEPRFVTKNYCGEITIFDGRPYIGCEEWCGDDIESQDFGKIKLSEFENKDWQECIYEVPRKTTGKIEKIDVGYKDSLKIKDWQDIAWTVERKINNLVDAVNELKENKGV